SRGNPGVAGYGALVKDARTGELLAERAVPLGVASNNVAEYSGLVAGLRAVLELGLAADAAVEVRMDSKLVVEQMCGRWKIKHEDMRRLALEARQLVDQVQADGGTVRFTWLPRERNGAADALSNVAMDGRTVHRDLVREGTGPEGPATAPEVSTVTGPGGARSRGHGRAEDDRPGTGQVFGDARVPLTDVFLSDE